eukprot:gi/632987872/ref/XP_007882797.1/ PREDICTED: uncharacterized protein LOC103171814 isoform X2 [Callorhinchus milii]
MENEKGSVTESKVKSSLLKRSSYQESFEDMLSGMDEKLKEFCAKKQKTNVRKPKKRGKTNTSSKTQDKDRGMVSPEAQQDLMVGGDGEMTDKRAENKTLEEDEASVNFNIHVRLERQEQVPSLDLRPREEQEHCLDSEEGQPLPEKLSDVQGVNDAKKTGKESARRVTLNHKWLNSGLWVWWGEGMGFGIGQN